MERCRLRDSCEVRLNRLDLPPRFGTGQLCDAVARERGKPIILRPLEAVNAEGAPCGIRIETARADFLFFEKRTSALHRMHILAHEISHVVCNHPGSFSLDGAEVPEIGLNPTLVRRMSARASYTTQDEREAEVMATLIRQRIYRGRELPPSQPRAGTERWEALFAEPRSWGGRR